MQFDMSSVQLDIEYLPHYNLEKWGELEYNHDGDAGFDLRYAGDCHIHIESIFEAYDDWKSQDYSYIATPHHYQTVPCGIKVKIPEGYQVEVRPRSGLAAKYGITIVNSPGTIDSSYTGEWKVILCNLGYRDFRIDPGDRIAQAVLMPVEKIMFKKVDNIVDDTSRNSGGFGSTGTT